MINPKKNDQTSIGCVSSKCVITFENVSTLIPIQSLKLIRNYHFTCSQAAFRPSFFSVFKGRKIYIIYTIN